MALFNEFLALLKSLAQQFTNGSESENKSKQTQVSLDGPDNGQKIN